MRQFQRALSAAVGVALSICCADRVTDPQESAVVEYEILAGCSAGLITGFIPNDSVLRSQAEIDQVWPTLEAAFGTPAGTHSPPQIVEGKEMAVLVAGGSADSCQYFEIGGVSRGNGDELVVEVEYVQRIVSGRCELCLQMFTDAFFLLRVPAAAEVRVRSESYIDRVSCSSDEPCGMAPPRLETVELRPPPNKALQRTGAQWLLSFE